jgi:hypothetical protein
MILIRLNLHQGSGSKLRFGDKSVVKSERIGRNSIEFKSSFQISFLLMTVCLVSVEEEEQLVVNLSKYGSVLSLAFRFYQFGSGHQIWKK